MGHFLFVEKVRICCIYYYLYAAHVQDTVEQEGIQFCHVVEHEKFVHVHRVASNCQVILFYAQVLQIFQNDIFALFQ